MNGVTDQSISPGIGGFVTFFLLACALWLLMRNMIGHLRKVDQREELDQERRARDVSSRPSSVVAAVPDEPRADHDGPHAGDEDRDRGGGRVDPAASAERPPRRR